MRRPAVLCAGVDWAKDAHEVLVADGDGEPLWSTSVTHDEDGITRLCQALVKLGVERVAVRVEQAVHQAVESRRALHE